MKAASARTAGLSYLQENKLEEAAAEFLKLIELAPNEALGYANLGIVYMRQDRLEDAEVQFEKALTLNESNLTNRENLVQLYELMDNNEQADQQLKKILENDPNNLFALHRMSEKVQMSPDDNSLMALEEYLLKIIESAPLNIVPRIYLLEHYLQNGQQTKAMKQFEDINSKFEQLNEDSKEYYDQAVELLRQQQLEASYTEMVKFHNHMKLSSRYQTDIQRLMGRKASKVGNPIISFSNIRFYGDSDNNLVYKNIRFANVTEPAGLTQIAHNKSGDEKTHSFVVANDLDNDGDQDLLFGSNVEGGNKLYLLINDLGRFNHLINKTGIPDAGTTGVFSDYNNDGYLDLLVLSDDTGSLHKNVDELTYSKVPASGLEQIKDGRVSLFFDADHDGDLDLFVGAQGLDRFFRNNGNDSFSDLSEQMGILGAQGATMDAAFGDFDDDGDIDLFVTNENGNRLYANQRLGKFHDLTQASGLPLTEGSSSVSSGDYNNDGFLDLFVSDQNGNYSLYANQEGGGFLKDHEFGKIKSIQTFKAFDHAFFDFDNDGFLDLIIAGDPLSADNKGIILLHNNPEHQFEDVSWILPEDVKPGRSLAIADYNEDGDQDVFLTYSDGSIGLLRNDGGNENHQLKIQLVGLREGSGKNNYFGIGSKVEMRAGPLYQMRTITSPNEYFGLGSYDRADILRIRWTNGVPQDIFSPKSSLELIEQERLKGSCPFLYTWNGEQFAFVKDIMWRSALGMPMGIMTSDESRSYAFPHASREYIMIPGDAMKTKEGHYQIKITGELWETIYLDELVLYAVDHPAEVDFRLDEKFVPPPFPELKFYPTRHQYLPVSVTDGKKDFLNLVSGKDHQYIADLKKSKFQGIIESRDLIIDLGRGIATEGLHLFMNGWIFPSDASINLAVSQSDEITAIPPYLQVINEKGHWETAIQNLGFPLGKNKTIISDLSQVFKTDDRRIRIRTSMQRCSSSFIPGSGLRDHDETSSRQLG